MVPSRTLFTGLALAVIGSSASAQSQSTTDSVTTIGTATYNLATGEVIRGVAQEKSAALATAFVNTDTSGFFGIGAVTSTTSGALQEWLDWGVVPTDNGSDIVGGFTFGYGTSVTDVLAGGPGASVTLRFYDGITGFCADSGAAATASFSFTGLPASGTPGTGAGWLITVDLTGGFEFCDAGTGNPFGFSFTTADDWNVDGTRDTGPLLCYAGDPFGPNGNPSTDADANGQVDVYDVWDDSPASNVCGSFFFGGLPANYSSWYVTYSTADTTGAATASSASRNGSGVNPVGYTVTADAVLGGTFSADIAQSNGGLGAFLVGYATPLTFPSSFGEILVNVADAGGELLQPFNGPYLFAGGTTTAAIPVPKNLNLCGVAVATQAVEFGAGVQLTNANDLVLGF